MKCVYDVSVDFRQRFLRLLSTTFCRLDYKLGMRYLRLLYFVSVEFITTFSLRLLSLSSILASKINFAEHEHEPTVTNDDLNRLDKLLSPHDIKRLEAYTNNCVDYHMVIFLAHLLPMLF